MSENAKKVYLDILSDELVSMYDITKARSVELVECSPMRKLLQENAEYVAHMPLSNWAAMIYQSQC